VSRRPLLVGLAGVLALAGIAVAVRWAPPRPRRRPPAPSAPARVVFLGDSITSGHRLAPALAYPARLEAALGIDAVNAGVSGDTTERALARLDGDVRALRPRIVVVALGLNDTFGQVPLERTMANLDAITRRLREDGAAVVLVHMPLPGSGLDPYRAPLRALARREGATLVEDFLDGVVPPLSYDGIHPDERGQARLADRLRPVLAGLLAR
jgi:acyl-CoA thioesterase-1